VLLYLKFQYYVMESIRIYLPEEIALKFRELAMHDYGYRKGALSKAAERILLEWFNAKKNADKNKIIAEFPECRHSIENPVEAVSGMLGHIKETSVDLQHKVSSMWTEKSLKHRH